MKTAIWNRLNLFSEALQKVLRMSPIVVSALLMICGAELFYGFLSQVGGIVFYFLAGLATYTLVEYVTHRFVLHAPILYDKHNGKAFGHAHHHAFPKMEGRLDIPLHVALVLAVVFYFLFAALLGAHVWFFHPGFVTGYAMYAFVHYLIHTKRPPNNAFRVLWRHHYLHHYKKENTAFGVLTTFWDIVFGTMPTINKAGNPPVQLP